MEKMSFNFQRAFGALNVNHYQEAIKFFQKDFEENPKNFASLNNMAVAKIHIGIGQQDQELLKDAIENLKDAIRICKEIFPNNGDYPIAEGNLEWAIEELNKKND